VTILSSEVYSGFLDSLKDKVKLSNLKEFFPDKVNNLFRYQLQDQGPDIISESTSKSPPPVSSPEKVEPSPTQVETEQGDLFKFADGIRELKFEDKGESS
jgi:hypothetical protein